MKIKNVVVALSILFFSCQKDAEINKNDKLIAPISDQVLETAVIYELTLDNILKKELLKHLQKIFQRSKNWGLK